MVAGRNLWNDDDKAIELILSLEGVAAEVLQSIPIASRKNYEEVISALQRKYGGEYKQDVYRMELRGRVQKPNETLQDFATEVERLTLLTYPGESHPLVDRIKIESFVNGIRDPEVKCAVYVAQKNTFAETLAFALAQETARMLSRPQVHKLRMVGVESDEMVSEVDQLKNEIKMMRGEVKAALSGVNKSKLKCFNCRKFGHISRDCRERRKCTRSSSPSASNDQLNQKPSNESSLN